MQLTNLEEQAVVLITDALELSYPFHFSVSWRVALPKVQLCLEEIPTVALYEAYIAETNSLSSKQGKDFYHLCGIYSKNSLFSLVIIFPYSVEYSIKPSLKLAITFNED